MLRQKVIAIFLIFGVTANANEVTYLEQGKPAPFTGYLFSTEQEKEIRYQLIDADFNTKRLQIKDGIISNYESQIVIYDKRLELYKNTSEELAKQMIANKDVSFWEKSFYFILGATLTGLVSYGLVNTLK